MKKISILVLFLSLFLILETPVFAEETPSVRATVKNEVQTDRKTVQTEISADKISLVKSRAKAEIDRRIASLNELITKVGTLKRLNSDEKNKFTNNIQVEINKLNDLKTKIDADSDIATLRLDQKSITQEYRIYMLFIPQLRILINVDREDETYNLIQQVVTKIEGRLGSDTTWQTTLNNAKEKLTDANQQYNMAEDNVFNLVPDNGDAAQASANTQALKSARSNLQTALTDFKNARAQLQLIINGFKKEPSPPQAN